MSEKGETPLSGVRVLDLGTMVAGPATAGLLGDFGAEVIKIEQPGAGDPLRNVWPTKDGIPLWWKVTSRNKKSVTLDLRSDEGAAIFTDLVADADVVIEAFRPGTMEKWGLGWDALSEVNPDLVMLRISGFGQTGPYKERAGFGRFAEAFSGLANLTGTPETPPLHAGMPIADYVTGVMGWAAVMTALYHRDTHPDGAGQYIDLPLFESLFRLMEFMVVEYDQLGVVRERTGNLNPSVAPIDVYRTADDEWVTFTGSTQNIAERLFEAIGQPELVEDYRFETNEARVEHREELEEIVSAWFESHELAEVEAAFEEHGLPFAPIMDISDILDDPHYRAREDVVEVEDDDLGPIRMQGVIPKFSETEGRIEWTGPELGEHTREVLCDVLGFDEEAVDRLDEQGVI